MAMSAACRSTPGSTEGSSLTTIPMLPVIRKSWPSATGFSPMALTALLRDGMHHVDVAHVAEHDKLVPAETRHSVALPANPIQPAADL